MVGAFSACVGEGANGFEKVFFGLIAAALEFDALVFAFFDNAL